MAVAHENNGPYTLKPSCSGSFTKRSISGQRFQKDELRLKNVVPTYFTTTNKACNSLSLEVLHTRLGHTSLSKVKHISVCKDVLSDTFSCDTCILAKAHRLPFERSTITTKAPFELVHMNLWGPYRVANLNGARFFVTIVDDYIRST